MSFSTFLLALYVFLQSEPVFLKWFDVDPKFTAFVGIVLVVVVVIEAIFWGVRGRPLIIGRRSQ